MVGVVGNPRVQGTPLVPDDQVSGRPGVQVCVVPLRRPAEHLPDEALALADGELLLADEEGLGGLRLKPQGQLSGDRVGLEQLVQEEGVFFASLLTSLVVQIVPLCSALLQQVAPPVHHQNDAIRDLIFGRRGRNNANCFDTIHGR